MKKNALRVPDYLGHILQAVERINTYTDDLDEAGFLQNQMAQDAVIRNIEIIGEAARNIEKQHPEFASLHPDIPWEDVYLMRNRVHMVTSQLIWKWSGRPYSVTFQSWPGKSGCFEMALKIHPVIDKSFSLGHWCRPGQT